MLINQSDCYSALHFKFVFRTPIKNYHPVFIEQYSWQHWIKASQSAACVTICSMSFTSTGNCLLITDSFGQMYLYRLSPISDPGIVSRHKPQEKFRGEIIMDYITTQDVLFHCRVPSQISQSQLLLVDSANYSMKACP